MNILEMLKQYTEENPNAAILFDEAHSKGITYAQLDELSGKVYAYLTSLGIGKEDFVLINLPRGIMPIIAMIGVWKSGAAWALVEDTYAPDRIAFIRKDCGCKAELSAANWEDIMNMEAKSGFVTADDHDAAYAIYTSGTTGNPKGVLHEYGNLTRAIDSIAINGGCPFNSKDRIALLRCSSLKSASPSPSLPRPMSVCSAAIQVLSCVCCLWEVSLPITFIPTA